MPDAAPSVHAELLACPPDTAVQAAPAPEPTWYCARADGTREGPFVTLFPDRTVKITGSYKAGKLDGPWRRNYPGGALAEEGAYTAGLEDGHWRQLAPDGHVLGEFDMKAGTGVEKRWFDDGPLYSERALRVGLPWGPTHIYAHDGHMVDSERYYAGRLDGPHVVGDKSTMRIEETWRFGHRIGKRQIWQFWEPTIDENYDDHGKLDGAFTIWRDRKTPRVQGTYDHGKRTGTWTWFDRGDNKERQGDYEDDKQTGAWFEWNDNKLAFSGNYLDGKPDGDFVYYDRNGNELGRYTMSGGNGTELTFYGNKKPATKTSYVDGRMNGLYEELTWRYQRVIVMGYYAGDKKHGPWREWTETRVPTLEQHWRHGKLDGKVVKYADGKVATTATYKNGLADGPYVEYRDGKPALTGQFTADKRTGTWTTYDADGGVTLIATYKNGVLDGPWHQRLGDVVIDGQLTAGRRTGTWTSTDKGGEVQKTTYAAP